MTCPDVFSGAQLKNFMVPTLCRDCVTHLYVQSSLRLSDLWRIALLYIRFIMQQSSSSVIPAPPPVKQEPDHVYIILPGKKKSR